MKTAALLTKHQKSRQIAPVLYEAGIELVEINFFDTDKLGTFSGEIERKLSARKCALVKAKKAAELSGLNVGIGSEGSFDSGPMAGMITWNQEVICLYQQQPELVVYASAEGPTSLTGIEAKSLRDLEQKLSQFNGQKWILRCADGILKGLSDQETLSLHQPPYTTWPVSIEPDLRAMHSPLRQARIQTAAQNLSDRLGSRCPLCNEVDFWPDEREYGPACVGCGQPTNEVKSLISRCKCCGHCEHKPHLETGSERFCNYCNP